MRRILFSWRGYNVYSYPAMLYLGLVAGVFVGASVAQRSGLNANTFAAAAVILSVPALVGSRLLFVLTHWTMYRREPRRIWRRSEGGMSMYGGLILAVPFSIPLLRVMGLPFGAFWDAAIVTILIGMALTRIGCLLNGCCAGRPTSGWFGLDLPDHRGIWQRRIPTQLLEMALAVMLFGVALVLHDSAPFPGAVFGSVIVAYAAVRPVLENLRDEETNKRDKPVMRTTSVLLVIAALVGLIVAWA